MTTLRRSMVLLAAIFLAASLANLVSPIWSIGFTDRTARNAFLFAHAIIAAALIIEASAHWMHSREVLNRRVPQTLAGMFATAGILVCTSVAIDAGMSVSRTIA